MNSTAAAAAYEIQQPWSETDDEEVRRNIAELNALREKQERLKPKKGQEAKKAQAEFPDLTLEQQQLAEESESILNKAWSKVKKACDFLVVKPVKWIGKQIKEHPIKALLIALAAFGIWYYWGPLTAGLSGLKEAGAKIAGEMLGKGISIDPSLVPRGITSKVI